MFKIFMEEKTVTICMVIFWLMGVLFRLLLGLLYQNMIKETDNMSATQNKLLKQCKLKFANCFQMNNGVSNIPVFVDRFLNRMSVGPFSFELLYHLSGQSVLVSVICAGVGICRLILSGRFLVEILPFYIATFINLYIYFSVSAVIDLRGKRRILKVNLIDFLENHLSARMQATSEDMTRLYGRKSVELMPIDGGQNLRLIGEEILNDRRSPKESEKPGEYEERGGRLNPEELEMLLQEIFAI